MNALQSGWEVLSHTPGFFSTAADSCPVMGMVLVCRALAMADRRPLSLNAFNSQQHRPCTWIFAGLHTKTEVLVYTLLTVLL